MEDKNHDPLKESLPAEQNAGKKTGASSDFEEKKSLKEKHSLFHRYRTFRRGGLSVMDSFFNSLYIHLSEKSVEKEKKRLRQRGKKVHSRHFLELHAPSLRFFSSFAKRFVGFASSPIRKRARRHSDLSKALFLKEHLPHLGVLLLALLVGCYIALTLSVPVVFRAEIEGKVIGLVGDKYTVDSAIDDLEDNAGVVLGKSFTFPYQVRYTIQRQRADQLTSKNEISAQLYSYVEDFICSAAGLYVDEKLVAVCSDEEGINETLEEFCTLYREGDEVGILNEIRVVTQAYPTEAIVSTEELFSLLEEMIKPLEERDKAPAAPSVLPEEGGAETGDLYLISDLDFSGQGRYGGSSHYPVSVQNIKIDLYTAVDQTYEKEIPYSTIYVESSDHYTCMVDTTVKGKSGRSRVTERTYYVDGKPVKQETLWEEVLEKPVSSVISIGTKLLPEEMGITSFSSAPHRFIVPRVGAVNYGYGYREDGFHTGIDIPGDRGDNLYAAASGTVIVAIGQDGNFSQTPEHSYEGYGFCVVIRHEDGYTTLYAHCSKINVTLGQRVKQGDKIGEVGNTGVSTGNHVHFEVRKDDRTVDPAKYLYQGTKTIYDKK